MNILKSILLKAGKLIVGDGTTLDDANILVQEDIISKVGPDVKGNHELEILDFSDRVVMPGIIDTHVHFCHDGNRHNQTAFAWANLLSALQVEQPLIHSVSAPALSVASVPF